MARIAPGHSGFPRVLSLFLLTGFLILAAQPSGLFKLLQPAAHTATVFTVNSTADGSDSNTSDGVCDDGTGNCTLRAAIQQANATPGDDTINFSITGMVSLSTALLDLTTNVAITGPGANLLTVQRSTASGTPNFRTFNIPGRVTVALSGLTISGGNPFSIGGGIFNSGTLNLTNCTVTGNAAGGGGIFGGNITNFVNTSVLVNDDSYAEGTETALLRLSNLLSATPLVLGSRDTATMEITDNDSAPSSANPADDTSFFVRQHYHDFLSREPDDSGLQFWTQNIESCGADQNCRAVKRVDTSAAFFLSIEFQETGFLVYKMNKAAFGNLPNKPVPVTLNSFLTDTQRIGQGLVVGAPGWEQQLETNKQAFADEFVARPRFTGVYPQSLTPEQYVDSLNANAGGVLSQTDRDSLVSDLKNGLKTRAQVLRAVAENPQMTRRESSSAFVLMQYFGYLRRDPDSAPDADFSGYNFWLSKLDQFNGNFRAAEMVRAFIESLEYRARFGQ